MLDIFLKFLLLGCVSFGGPAAHIGYFHNRFVDKLKWIDEAAYARLIALSQFLPGPGSSQVGFALGLNRAGLAGGMAAFVGFTLPSFLLMYLAATFSASFADDPHLLGLIAGLKLLAVVVVADASATMYKNFCQTRLSAGIAVATAATLLVLPDLLSQLAVLAGAALTGVLFGQQGSRAELQTASRIRPLPLLLFVLLLIGLPLARGWTPALQLLADFYQAGSLVFGGGHVVLPLLQGSVGDQISPDRFLLGYAAAQAVPGPMFTLATFLGAELQPASPLSGALLATAAIFLPGFLLVLALHGAWQEIARRPLVAGAVWGINAAVVGLLLSALYQPVFVSAVTGPRDIALLAAGLFVLRVLKAPILVLVAGFSAAGLLLH
uniref:chromate efflux transporter n=1 Tax=Marinobacterium arenosum TaxID=2862496 RepID=UPI0036F29FE9